MEQRNVEKMTLSKEERNYLIEHHKQIIEEHKKGIEWHTEAIKNNQKRINSLLTNEMIK